MTSRLDGPDASRPVYSPICTLCRHFHQDSRQGQESCDAFDKIPDEIWHGRNNHRRPFDGDNGIRFEPLPD